MISTNETTEYIRHNLKETEVIYKNGNTAMNANDEAKEQVRTEWILLEQVNIY
jgi:hypothetical protein